MIVHEAILSPRPARRGRRAQAPLVRPVHAAHVALLLLLALTSGCASVQRPDPGDPLESFNRTVFDFNEAVDDAVLKPVATAYVDSVPSRVRRGVSNFFSNLRDAWSFVNNLLQARPTGAADSVLRFGVNTVFGLGGLLDVAGEMRIPRHTQDFGQTLGYWGVPPGPYLVLPFLGPSTVRDTAALPADYWGDLARLIDPAAVRYPVYALRIVDTRANLLRTTSLLSDIALDKYSFTRDAYLQLRRASIGGDEPGEDGSARKRDRAQETAGSVGADDDADAGREPDYTQPAADDARQQKAGGGKPAPDNEGKAPDYTQPADEDDAGKAPDYTKP